MSHPLVVDASVAAKWIVHEQDSEAAVEIALSGRDLLAPQYVLVEVANAVRKNVKSGHLDAAAATAAWEELLRSPLALTEVDISLATAAFELGLALQHPVQDCLYLALALRADAQVLTDDRRFAAAVRRRAELAGRVVLLGETIR